MSRLAQPRVVMARCALGSPVLGKPQIFPTHEVAVRIAAEKGTFYPPKSPGPDLA